MLVETKDKEADQAGVPEIGYWKYIPDLNNYLFVRGPASSVNGAKSLTLPEQSGYPHDPKFRWARFS